MASAGGPADVNVKLAAVMQWGPKPVQRLSQSQAQWHPPGRGESPAVGVGEGVVRAGRGALLIAGAGGSEGGNGWDAAC